MSTNSIVRKRAEGSSYRSGRRNTGQHGHSTTAADQTNMEQPTDFPKSSHPKTRLASNRTGIPCRPPPPEVNDMPNRPGRQPRRFTTHTKLPKVKKPGGNVPPGRYRNKRPKEVLSPVLTEPASARGLTAAAASAWRFPFRSWPAGLRTRWRCVGGSSEECGNRLRPPPEFSNEMLFFRQGIVSI